MIGIWQLTHHQFDSPNKCQVFSRCHHGIHVLSWFGQNSKTKTKYLLIYFFPFFSFIGLCLEKERASKFIHRHFLLGSGEKQNLVL